MLWSSSRIHADILRLIAAHRDPGKLCRRGYAAAPRLEWVADSHYPFFPTLPDERFGYLHPVALAMNKVMAAEFSIIFAKRNHNYRSCWSGAHVPSQRGRSCR
jgi:hypothetical protein